MSDNKYTDIVSNGGFDPRHLYEQEQKITWSYQHGDEKIIFEFHMDGMNHKEMFMLWVKFMNAVGYTLDPIEMESMWNGE